jgi:hypothetical protein
VDSFTRSSTRNLTSYFKVHTESKPQHTFPLDKCMIIAEGKVNENLMDSTKFDKKLEYVMKQELTDKNASHKLSNRVKGFEAELQGKVKMIDMVMNGLIKEAT